MSEAGFTPVTVNLHDKALGSLEWAADRTGYSRTDVINRALQFYVEILEADPGLMITWEEAGRTRVVVVRQ